MSTHIGAPYVIFSISLLPHLRCKYEYSP